MHEACLVVVVCVAVVVEVVGAEVVGASVAGVDSKVGARVGLGVGLGVPVTLNDAEEYAVLSLLSHPSPSGSKHVQALLVTSYIRMTTRAVTSGSVHRTRPI